MGFFSWKTQDTNRSISNRYSKLPTFPVVMLDNKGNEWIEENYEGYGSFGGKDFFELLAQMNGKTTREEGISLYFGESPCISPNLIEKVNLEDYVWVDESPERCPDQGYFYEDPFYEDPYEDEDGLDSY